MPPATLTETLSISVRASEETNDHEVLLLTEQGSLVERFGGDKMIGLDPDDILQPPCQLLTASESSSIVIGRCSCGIVECGSVDATVTFQGETIVWTNVPETTSVRFDATQYVAEVERSLRDFSWETPDRTAARLTRENVDHARLLASGLTYCWASTRVVADSMTVLLEYRWQDQELQILVEIGWQGESPQVLAEKVVEVLRAAPETWGPVRWIPRGRDSTEPHIVGPGWSKIPGHLFVRRK